MSRKVFLASFAHEQHLLSAVQAARKRDWDIVDIYSPYPVHGLEPLLAWRRSLLPVACFFGGAAGIILALWFQFWSTARSWPIDVGGRPWNSLPAFVPVTFECMVLFAGFAVVIAFFLRCRLYPGKTDSVALKGLTDDRFALAVRDPGEVAEPGAVHAVMHECHVLELIESVQGEPR
jgi:hypothetical protein